MKKNFIWRFYLIILLSTTYMFSAKLAYKPWERGVNFERYLSYFDIPRTIINDLDEDDAVLISDIGQVRNYYELIASNGVLLQSLIPISEELQVHLFRTHTGYKVEIIPIAYQKDTYVAILSVKSSPHADIVKKTKNLKLANAFTRVLKHSVDFRGIQKGDKIAIVYTQKMRLGRPLGLPDIKVAMLESHNKKNYVFKHTDGKYYNDKGKVLIQKYMQKPLNHVRITSGFTNRRWHPVLKRWKAHLGTDFGARRGTPILAAADGKVVFSGRLGGYGNVIKIRHKDGYLTLYAHQSRRKAKVGQHVNAGQIIGYVGSTGRSTGPHLHFGLYKNGRAINPMRMVKFSTAGLTGKGKRAFLNRKRKFTKIIDRLFKDNIPSHVWNTVQENGVTVQMKRYYQNRGW